MSYEKNVTWAEDRLDDLIEKVEGIIVDSKRPAEETILNEEEALKVLKVSKRTLATFRAEGLLVYSKVRGVLFYTYADILAMIRSHQVVLTTAQKSRLL